MENKLYKIADKISEWALYSIIFTLPFSKSLVEISIVVAIASLVLKKFLARERLLINTHIELLLYIFLMASLVSIFNAHSAQMGLSVRALFSKALKFAALFLVAKEIINTREKLTNFVTMAALSCIVVLIDCFVQYYITHVDLLHNYSSFLYFPETPSVLGVPTASFPFQNDFAAWILIFIFPAFCFALFVKNDLWKRALAGSAFIGLAYALILTKVRGAWLAFTISFIILSIIKLKKIGWALLLVGILLLAMYNGRYLLSMQSMNDRSVMWKNSVTIFQRHPIIGNGLNTFYDNYMRVRQDDMRNKHGSYAHNCYLQMAAETGLVGLISFIAFLLSVIIKGFRSLTVMKDPFYYSLALGINLGLKAFLIHSAGDTNLYSLPLAALFWLSSGVLLAVIKISESGPETR